MTHIAAGIVTGIMLFLMLASLYICFLVLQDYIDSVPFEPILAICTVAGIAVAFVDTRISR